MSLLSGLDKKQVYLIAVNVSSDVFDSYIAKIPWRSVSQLCLAAVSLAKLAAAQLDTMLRMYGLSLTYTTSPRLT